MNPTRKRIAVMSIFLTFSLAWIWTAASYSRFLRERDDYDALLRSLPEEGTTVEYARRTMADFEALVRVGPSTSLDILFFNDSTMGDGDSSLSVLLGLLLGRRLEAISGAGFSATVAIDVLRLIRLLRGTPVAVIIPVNLRGFADIGPFQPTYYRNFRAVLDLHSRWALWDFIDCKRGGYSSATSYYVHRFKPVVLKASDYFTGMITRQKELFEATRERIPAAKGNASQNGNSSMLLAESYHSAYMVDVDEVHPLLISLLDLIQDARSFGAIVYVYVTPVDFQTGIQLLGPDFISRLKRNVGVISSSLAQRGVVVFDFSCLLGQHEFTDREYANEHMTPAGRERVALRLAEVLRSQ